MDVSANAKHRLHHPPPKWMPRRLATRRLSYCKILAPFDGGWSTVFGANNNMGANLPRAPESTTPQDNKEACRVNLADTKKKCQVAAVRQLTTKEMGFREEA